MRHPSQIDIRNWGVVAIDGQPHLVGNPAFGTTRMSTPLIMIEPGTGDLDGYAESTSGQMYTLVGAHGSREQVFSHVLSIMGGAIVSHDIEVLDPDDAARAVRGRGVQP